jgi:hypothetical protein
MSIKFMGLLLWLNFAIAIFVKGQGLELDKIEKDIFIKKIDTYKIVYDCYNRRQTTTDKIIVYAKRQKARIKLLTYEFGDNYIEDVAIKYFLNYPFIYVTSGHTHGHFNGALFILDLKHFKTTEVKLLPNHLKNKAPGNLEFRNNNGIRVEKNKIMDGAYYRDKNGVNYSVDVELKIIKTGPNDFALKAMKQVVSHD